MDLESLSRRLKHLPPFLLRFLEKQAKRIPALRRQIEAETNSIVSELEESLKPYQDETPVYTCLPETGLDRRQALAEMQALQDREQSRWQAGFVSGAVYNGDPEHIDFLNQVYALHSQTNPLHADVWPSISKYEAEIIAMTARMLGGASAGSEGNGSRPEVVGSVASGGTEAILLAMKAYRDWARDQRGIRQPEVIAPVTAHAAFDKAAQYFNLRLVRIPVDEDFRADVQAARRAITCNTIAIVGSAPSFPHGTIDPIEALSELARAHRIGFHTDACLGGFLLPFGKKLGYAVPAFDFSLPGVTSMTADTHKYGYAAKGTSVVLYRGAELRHYQYYTTGEWPGGLYCSPTFAGSRPGGLSAACWAAMVTVGEAGYTEAARRIFETAANIRAALQEMPEVRLLGDSLFVVAFTTHEIDVYQVMDAMTGRGWSLNALFQPPAVHLCVTLRHTQPGVADRFVTDLRAAMETVKASPEKRHGIAPVYGLAATIPMRGLVDDMLKLYMDVLYKP